MTENDLLNEIRKKGVIEHLIFVSAYWDFSLANFNNIDKIVFKNCQFLDSF